MSQTHQDNNIGGIIMAVFAFFAFFISDAIRKILVEDYSVFDILFWQSFIGLAFVGILIGVAKDKKRIFNRVGLKWQITRGILMAANTALSLWAISHMPVMDAYTIYFLTPFVVTILAAIIFKEKIGWHRMSSILIGFLGAFIAFRPGFAEINPAYGIALCCVFTFSSASLIARQVGQGGGLLAFAFWPFLCLGGALFVYLGLDIRVPSEFLFWSCCCVAGVFYALGLIAIAKSYIIAPASVVAPYQYVQIVFAIGFGYLVFGDIPDFFKMLGAAIISGSGIFLFYRERLAKKRAQKKAKGSM